MVSQLGLGFPIIIIPSKVLRVVMCVLSRAAFRDVPLSPDVFAIGVPVENDGSSRNCGYCDPCAEHVAQVEPVPSASRARLASLTGPPPHPVWRLTERACLFGLACPDAAKNTDALIGMWAVSENRVTVNCSSGLPKPTFGDFVWQKGTASDLEEQDGRCTGTLAS
jgi:hypothetical protein